MQVQDTAVDAAVKARVRRGMGLVDNVERHGDLYTVKASGRDWWYTVSLDNSNGETCQCKDWREHGFGHICKHIYAVTLVVAKS